MSIRKAINIINKYPQPIINWTQICDIPGIGDGVARRINEILTTGGLAELDEEPSAFVKSLQSLTSVIGIGESLAKKLLIDYKIQSVEELRKGITDGKLSKIMNNQVMIGIKYYDDLQLRITRAEIKEVGDYIKNIPNIISSSLNVDICGSYRRGKMDSHDIDIMIMHPEIRTSADIGSSEVQWLQILVDQLIETGIIASLTYGPTKFMGVIYWWSDALNRKVARRIDIIWVPKDSYYSSLLHFTGSDLLNRSMRMTALKLGYTLNNHGIYPLKEAGKYKNSKGADTINHKTIALDEKAPKHYITDVKIPLKSEKEIFDILGMKYLEPHER